MHLVLSFISLPTDSSLFSDCGIQWISVCSQGAWLASVHLWLDLSGWRVFMSALHFFFPHWEFIYCINSHIEHWPSEISVWTLTCFTFPFLVLVLKGEFLFSCLIPRWCDKLRFMTLICLHRDCEITFQPYWKIELIKALVCV